MIARRALLVGSSSALFAAPLGVQACDDPPRHYKKPCKTAYSRYSAYVPVAIGQELFAKNKVNTAPVLIERLADIMLDPDLGAACLRGPELADALRAGVSLTIIATPIVNVVVGLWAGIGGPKTLTDLKSGATIAVGESGSGSYLALQTFAKESGTSIDRFKLTATDRTGRVDSLQARSADLALFSPITATDSERLRSLGFNKIQEGSVPVAREVLVVRRDALADPHNMPFFRGVVATLKDSIQFLQQERNRVSSIRAIVSHSKLDAAMAEGVYAEALQASPRLTADVRAVQGLFADLILGAPAAMAPLKGVSPESLVTQQVVSVHK